MPIPPWRTIRPRTLYLQAVVIVSLLLIATIGLYAWHTTSVQSANLTRQLQDRAALTAKNIADLSVNFLLTEDFAALEGLLLKTGELPDVSSITVCSPDGIVVSQVERSGASAPQVKFLAPRVAPPRDGAPRVEFSPDGVTAWHPVQVDALIGWARTTYSLTFIRDLQKRVWTESLLLAVLIITVSIALIMLFLSRVVEAVRAVTAFAARLNEQTGEQLPGNDSSLEIRQLVSSLNLASRRLAGQKRSIEESTKNLEKLRRDNLLILESAGEGILGLDREGRHTFVNPAAAAMLGYGTDELEGRDAHGTWHGDRGGDCVLCKQLRDGARHREEDAVFWTKDRSAVLVAYTVMPIREGDTLTGSVVTFLDISAAKLAEQSLRESELKYRTLFESSQDVIYISNPDGRLIDINPAGVKLFGYASKEELLSVNIARDLYANPTDRKRFIALMAEQGYVKNFEVAMKRKTGGEVIVMISGNAVHDTRGGISAYRGIIRDMTEQRKLQLQLQHAQKMEAVGQLTGGIAHDFNNYLSAIIGFAYVLQMKLKHEEQLRTAADQILLSAERAANLTKSLLAFSRRQPISLSPMRLNDVVRRAQKLLSKLAGEENQLELHCEDDDAVILADSTQIEQILINLAANARDAMPNGGVLLIETQRFRIDDAFHRQHGFGVPGDYHLLSVADSGTGMDAQTAKRIFEPFFTTKEVGKGTGLGLSIVYGIVKQHNGFITVSSEPGRGTTFRIYLPLTENKTEQAPTVAADEPLRGAETVLLAEDYAEVRHLTSTILEDHGYRVIEAVDGADAVSKFQEHRDEIDLVILDVIMPKKNGREAYEEIRNMKPEIKALFISGYAAALVSKKKILEDGLNFIAKPLSPRVFLRKIRDVVKGKPADP